MSFLGFLQWLEATKFSTSLRESVYMWAVVDGLHIMGLCVFLGLLLFWELRLFNVGVRTASVSETWDRLSPWIFGGFVYMVITGLLLFSSDPVRFWGNIFFIIKMVAMLIAGLNAIAFHYTIGKRLVDWDTRPMPGIAHAVGVASITLWVLIVFCGRLIAYNWFDPWFELPA